MIQEKARKIVFEYALEHMDKSDDLSYFSIDDVYVVWFCYILGGWKVAYKKWDNRCYK